jgi:hypothetical protein
MQKSKDEMQKAKGEMHKVLRRNEELKRLKA